MIFTVSGIPRFFWNTVSAAFMPPGGELVFPPVMSIFSSTTTFTFASRRCRRGRPRAARSR